MNLFKKKSPAGPVNEAARQDSHAAPNPYLNAQRVWNSHVGSLVASRTTFTSACFIAERLAATTERPAMPKAIVRTGA